MYYLAKIVFFYNKFRNHLKIPEDSEIFSVHMTILVKKNDIGLN